MKFLPALLLATALAATACTGTATISGSSVGSIAKAVRPAAPNADQDITDLNRPNPPINKSTGRVPSVATAHPSITTKIVPSSGRDRCNTSTRHPGALQPMCPPA